MSLDRKELKLKGHQALQENYWKTCFMTALLLSLSVGTVFSAVVDFMDEAPTAVRDIYRNLTAPGRKVSLQVVAVMITLAFGLILLTTIFKIAFDIFISNPIEVGARLFMKKNLRSEEKGLVADMAYAFDHNYLHLVKCMLYYRFVMVLWTLLLLVPGVIKHYEYSLVPYLLTDHPELTAREAMKLSSQMMKGHKKEAFLMDLSFIPWYLAGVVSLGILSFFFVMPYRAMTWAVLYDALENPAEPAAEAA